MDTLVALVGIVAGTVGLLLFVNPLLRRRARKRAVAWALAAKTLSGTFTSTEEPHRPGGLRIEAEVEGALVGVTTVIRGSGRAAALVTEVEGSAASLQLELCLSPRGKAAPYGTRLHDVRTATCSDQELDARYVTKTNDVELTRAWLQGPVRSMLLEATGYAFVIEGRRARAIVIGIEGDAARLVSAVETVAALAKGGLDLLQRARAVAEDVDGVAEERDNPDALGGLELVISGSKATVVVDVVHHAAAARPGQWMPWIRVLAESASGCPPFVAVHTGAPEDALEVEGLDDLVADDPELRGVFRLRSADGGKTRARLDEPTVSLLLAAAPTVLADDGSHVTALLEGVAARRERLAAIVELVTTLASRGSSPYR